jgi:uncharacterized protein HemY
MNRKSTLLDMLASEPEDSFLHHALGMEHLRDQEFDAALLCFKTAMALEPGYAPSAYQAALVLFQQNRMVEAFHCIQQGKQHALAHGQTKMAQELEGLAQQMDDET